ncbi:uncharacterized protein BDV17DRAFT_288424 [Aspergillus undulatus]|uniref:uncharacterized protein n=1 Tax=Aspergillus undulatus TaxID=1810928 RepID=UPI003CCD646E
MSCFRPFGIYTDTLSGTPISDFEFPRPGITLDSQSPITIPSPTHSPYDYQATNLGVYLRETIGIGFYIADNGFTRPGQGIATELITWNILGSWHAIPVRLSDLFELEKAQPMEVDEEEIKLGRFGYRLWMSPQNNLCLGYGETVKVAQRAKVALVDRFAVYSEVFGADASESGLEPRTGFLPQEDGKSRRPWAYAV